MKNYKRWLSALLVLLMCISLFPVSAIAEGEAADAAEEEIAEIAEPAAAEEPAAPAEPEVAEEEPAEDLAEEPADPAEPAEELAPQTVETQDGDTSLTLSYVPGNRLYADSENGYYSYAIAVSPNEALYVYVEAEGEDVSYTYYVVDEDGSLTEMMNDTENGITIPFVKGTPTRYVCHVSDLYNNYLTVDICLVVSTSMYVSDASGDYVNTDNDGTLTYYNYSVPITPGSDAELRVELDGLSADELDEVTYQWCIYDEDEQDYVALAGEDSDTLTISDPADDTSFRCEITDGWGARIYVYFYVYYSNSGPGPGPGYVCPEPYYGTTSYYTTPGLPVDLRVKLPDDIGADDYDYCVWSYLTSDGAWRTLGRTEEPRLVISPAGNTQYMLYISSRSYSFDRVYFYVSVLPWAALAVQDQDYFVLSAGDEISLPGMSFPAYWVAESEWIIEEEYPSSDPPEFVVDIDEPDPDDGSCTVTAISAGTSFVSWMLSGTAANGETVVYGKLRYRIDVIDTAAEDAVLGVSLPDTAVTTNLYNTFYSTFRVLVALENNQFDTQGVFIDRDEEGNELANSGAIIEEAWFTDGDADKAFALRVVDDSTLEVVPNIDFDNPDTVAAAVAAVKNSYKSTVTVKLRDVDTPLVTPQQLTLSVKKTLPSVKAKAVTLNSFIDEDRQDLILSGSWVTDLRTDPSKTNPEWASLVTSIYDDGSQSYALEYFGERDGKYSGKVNLLATVYGCAVEVPLVVTVKAAKTAPKLKAAGTITLSPLYCPSGETEITAAPYSYYYARPTVTKITEGKNTWSKDAGNLNAAPISCSLYSYYQSWGLSAYISNPSALNSSKDQTFKVTVTIRSATTTVTVKTLKADATPKLKLKASGTIDTMIPGSPATISWTGTNMQGLYPSYSIHQYQGSTDKGVVAPGIFKLYAPMTGSAEVSNAAANVIPKNYTYYVHADIVTSRGDLVLQDAAKIKLNVKWTTAHAKITTSLKAAGAVDLIRPDSAATLTPGDLKNCYTASVGVNSLKFSTDKEGSSLIDPDELPFDVKAYGKWNAAKQRYSPVFYVTLRDEFRGVLKTTDKYYAFIDMNADGQRVTTKPVQIKITKGSAKVTADVKTVTLLKNDRYSYAQINLVVPSGVTAVRSVLLDAKSDARFDLVDNGCGSVELHYDAFAENPTTPAKATVKLAVYLYGNTTGKPDATISVSVKFA